MRPQSNKSTLVAHVVSALISTTGIGALSIQTGFYLLSLGQRETRSERATVLLLYLISFAQTVIDCTGAIRYLSHGLSHQTTLASSTKMYIEFTLSPLLGVLIIGICHIFIAARILSFASSVQTSARFLRRTIFWIVCCGVAFCCLLGTASIAVVWATIVLLPQGRVTSNAIQAFNILSSVYSFFCCAIDISLAAFVAWETAKAKSIASSSADHVLRLLRRITLCSAVITVLAQAFKSTLVFLSLTGWAGSAFSVACAAYPITLLLSISLPRAKSTQLAQGQGCSHPPGSHDFFSPSKSHDLASSSLVPQYGSTLSPAAIGELEKQQYASLSRSPSREDGEMGFLQMLEDSERELGGGHQGAFGVQMVAGGGTSSLPSTPAIGAGPGTFRPSSPPRMLSFTAGPRHRPSSTPLLDLPGTSTYSPTDSAESNSFPAVPSIHPPPPSPYLTHPLDEPPLSYTAPVSRSSSIVRPRMTERRATYNAAVSKSAGDVPEAGGSTELNLEYIFAGLGVQSVSHSASRSKKTS